MVRIALCLFAALLALPSVTHAQIKEDIFESCSIETAKPVTIAQLHSDPELRFQCVSVEGVLNGLRLHHDRLAVVAPIEPFDPDDFEDKDKEAVHAAAPSPNRVMLAHGSMPEAEGPVRARVVGVVNNCSRMYDEAEEYYRRQEEETGESVIWWLTGTCHSHSEVFVDPVAVTFLELKPLTRFTETDVAVEQSDLVEFEESELPDGLELGYAEMLIEALANRDRALFHIATEPQFRPADFELEENSQLGAQLIGKAGGSGFELRLAGESFNLGRFESEKWFEAVEESSNARRVPLAVQPPRKLYFLQDTLDYELEYPDDRYPREVIACWCKSADCSGKWPVFETDADALFDRPYYCVMLEQTRIQGREGWFTYATLRDAEYGFAEPDWDDDGQPG